jgi:hypothetical protein
MELFEIIAAPTQKLWDFSYYLETELNKEGITAKRIDYIRTINNAIWKELCRREGKYQDNLEEQESVNYA